MLVERAEYRAVTPTHGTALLSGYVHTLMHTHMRVHMLLMRW